MFQAPEEELAYASGNLRLFITDGDIQLVYHVFPDGTLTRQREDDSLGGGPTGRWTICG